MKQLRHAAARERWIPILWWFQMLLVMGLALFVLVHRHSPPLALLMAILMVVGWGAPLVAVFSLAVPARAQRPAPAPGTGSFKEWLAHVRALARLLLYYEENPDLPPGVRRALHDARGDLRATLKTHPLRDDLERVCQRVRDGAVREMKAWLWLEYHPRLQDLVSQYGQSLAAAADEDERLMLLQETVENAAAWMTRHAMPRMLERERLACASDCAWLAAQAAAVQANRISPIELAAALVVEWGDFSEPWRPARVLHSALARLESRPAPETAGAAPAGEAGNVVVRNGKRYRRVRVRRQRRHRHYRGPSFVDILLSFGQWVKYSLRSWLFYR